MRKSSTTINLHQTIGIKTAEEIKEDDVKLISSSKKEPNIHNKLDKIKETIRQSAVLGSNHNLTNTSFRRNSLDVFNNKIDSKSEENVDDMGKPNVLEIPAFKTEPLSNLEDRRRELREKNTVNTEETRIDPNAPTVTEGPSILDKLQTIKQKLNQMKKNDTNTENK